MTNYFKPRTQFLNFKSFKVENRVKDEECWSNLSGKIGSLFYDMYSL